MSTFPATRIKTRFRKYFLAVPQGMFAIDGWKRGVTMTELESACGSWFSSAWKYHNNAWHKLETESNNQNEWKLMETNGNKWKRAKGNRSRNVQNSERSVNSCDASKRWALWSTWKHLTALKKQRAVTSNGSQSRCHYSSCASSASLIVPLETRKIDKESQLPDDLWQICILAPHTHVF